MQRKLFRDIRHYGTNLHSILYRRFSGTGKNGFEKFLVFAKIFAKKCVRVVIDQKTVHGPHKNRLK